MSKEEMKKAFEAGELYWSYVQTDEPMLFKPIDFEEWYATQFKQADNTKEVEELKITLLNVKTNRNFLQSELIKRRKKIEKLQGQNEELERLNGHLTDLNEDKKKGIELLEKQLSDLQQRNGEDAIAFAEWVLKNKSKNNIKIYDESDKWTFWKTGNAYGSQLTSAELYTLFKSEQLTEKG